jgi:hypothetical protein
VKLVFVPLSESGIDPELLRKLGRLAAAKRLTIDELIRAALDRFIEREKRRSL